MKQHTPGSAMARYGCRGSGRSAGHRFAKNRNLHGRPQGRTRAVPFAELSLSNSGSGDARPDLTRRVLGSDLNKVSSAGEWVGRKRRYAGRSAGAATPSVPG